MLDNAVLWICGYNIYSLLLSNGTVLSRDFTLKQRLDHTVNTFISFSYNIEEIINTKAESLNDYSYIKQCNNLMLIQRSYHDPTECNQFELDDDDFIELLKQNYSLEEILLIPEIVANKAIEWEDSSQSREVKFHS